MAYDILDIMDSFSLNEDETDCVGLSQTEVNGGTENCKFSVFMVIYGYGTIHAPGFCIALSKPLKCARESFKMHVLKDNIFHLIFYTSQTRDQVLFAGL